MASLPASDVPGDVVCRAAMRLGSTWRHLVRDLRSLQVLDEYDALLTTFSELLALFGQRVRPQLLEDNKVAETLSDVHDTLMLLSSLATRSVAHGPRSSPSASSCPPRLSSASLPGPTGSSTAQRGEADHAILDRMNELNEKMELATAGLTVVANNELCRTSCIAAPCASSLSAPPLVFYIGVDLKDSSAQTETSDVTVATQPPPTDLAATLAINAETQTDDILCIGTDEMQSLVTAAAAPAVSRLADVEARLGAAICRTDRLMALKANQKKKKHM